MTTAGSSKGLGLWLGLVLITAIPVHVYFSHPE